MRDKIRVTRIIYSEDDCTDRKIFAPNSNQMRNLLSWILVLYALCVMKKATKSSKRNQGSLTKKAKSKRTTSGASAKPLKKRVSTETKEQRQHDWRNVKLLRYWLSKWLTTIITKDSSLLSHKLDVVLHLRHFRNNFTPALRATTDR